MGHNDHFEDDYPELPPEAGTHTSKGFEPDNEWLRSADPALCREAMRLWFLSRFCDPVHETPYDGREGGYLFVHGGPYSAEAELYGRFGDFFQDEIIRAVIDEVEADGIYDWAPIHTEPDYDADFELEIEAEGSPYQLFLERLSEADALGAAVLDAENQKLLRQLLYSHLIAALEAYLADTMAYWLKANKNVFRRFVANCEEFKKEKLSLSHIFQRLEYLDEEVEKYIQKTVWHRLDKVIPLLSVSFGFTKPEIGPLMEHIVTRHDIVHRGGKTKGGSQLEITQEKLVELRVRINEFVKNIESEIEKSVYGGDF